MKISIILIALLYVNTAVLLAETIGRLLSGVSIWVLLIIEGTLVIGYYVNRVVRDVRKVAEIDLTNLNLFVVKNKKSA